MKRITSTVLLLLLSAALGACSGRERGPDRTVRRFFRAMNEKDVNQLLSCVDPKQERMLKATFRLIEKATGFPMDDVFELLPGLHQAFGAQIREDFRFTKIRIRSRDVSGTTAKLVVSVNSLYRSGTRETKRLEDFEFTLEQFEEAGWRITGVRARAVRSSYFPCTTSHTPATVRASPATRVKSNCRSMSIAATSWAATVTTSVRARPRRGGGVADAGDDHQAECAGGPGVPGDLLHAFEWPWATAIPARAA